MLRVDPGETDTLPHDKTLRFKSTFDGELIIFNNNCVVDKRKLSADKYIELNGLSYGLGVQVVIGLDVIWQIDFKKQQPIVVNDEIEMLKELLMYQGQQSRLRTFAKYFSGYELLSAGMSVDTKMY